MSAVCQCGCGEPAPIAKVSNRAHGVVAGEPLAFLPNHKRRVNRELRPCITNPLPGQHRIWHITPKGKRYLARKRREAAGVAS